MVLMLLSRRAKEIIFSVLMLAIPVVFLFANIKEPHRLNALDRFILRLSSPVHQASVFIYRWVDGLWMNYIYLVDLKSENDRLRSENGILKANNAILEIWAQRGREVEKLLGFKEASSAEMVAARVISKSFSPYYRVLRLRIDRGVHEIKPDDPVIIPEGVVGKVHRVYGGYADIQLAIDPKVKIPVVVKRTGTEALLVGTGDPRKYTARLTYLRREEEVQVGDVVVTSGMGGDSGVRFPADLQVGRIVSVQKKEFGKFQDAVVEAAVDFSRLDKVLVVVTPPPVADPQSTPDAELQKEQPRTGLRPF